MKFIFLSNLLSFLLACNISFAAELKIASASNFAASLKQISERFEAKTGIKLLISSASSGKHASQIKYGAPFDIFLSASPKYIDYLDQQNLIISASRYVYAKGQLVVWGDHLSSIDDLSQISKNEKWVIANPKTAPYGKAGKQFLEKRQTSANIITADNIAHAFQLRFNGNVPYGLLALSQMKQKQINDYWLVPAADYDPIIQELAIIKSSKNQVEAQKFINFLKSDDISALIKKHGYLVD